MAVTGDVWLSLSLGQVFPEIDPNNPGSTASLLRDKVNEVEGRFQATVSAANDVISASSAVLGQLDVVGNAINGAHAGIEELVDNAGNTGVYFKLIGVCPDFPNSLLRNSQEFSQAVAREMLAANRSEELKVREQQIARAEIEQREALKRAEELAAAGELEERQEQLTIARQQQQLAQQLRQEQERAQQNIDPCIPDFSGSTAKVGGLVGVVGAANPLALWEKLKVLAEIFPGLAAVISDGVEKFQGIGDATAEFLDNFSTENLANLAEQFNNFREELSQLGKSPFVDLEDIPQGDGCNDWLCGRLKDVLPFLDPDRPGSAMNVAMDFSDEVVGDFVATLRSVSSLQQTAARLIGEVGQFQGDLNSFKNKIFEFADNLAATGVALHPIGRDGSLNNNEEFVDAVRQSLFDREDPGRPVFRGDSAVVAGFLIVIGAPTTDGLKDRFEAVSSAINGFNGKFNAVADAAGRVEEAFGKLSDSVNTSEVDSAFKVRRTAPQQGGTDSTLLAAGEAALDGNNPLDAASETAEENRKATQLAALTSSEEIAVSNQVASAKVTSKQNPNDGNSKVELEPSTTESNFTIPAGTPPIETPLVNGETDAPADSGSATQAIAALLRSAKRSSEGLG